MNCELCKRDNAEYVGITCGKYRVCTPCIKNLIEKEMKPISR